MRPGRRRAPLRSAFWRGWLAGAAFFLISTWWVAEAFQVDAAEQGWMAPIAVALLAGGLGLFWGAAALYAWLRPVGFGGRVVFAGCFGLFEWLRGHVLTGFPWDLAGETWRAGSAPSQAAALVGAYGLSWITVAACRRAGLLWPGTAPPVRLDRRRRGGLVAVAVASTPSAWSGWPTRAPDAPERALGARGAGQCGPGIQVRRGAVPLDPGPLCPPHRAAGGRPHAGHRHLAGGGHPGFGQRLSCAQHLDSRGDPGRPEAGPDPAAGWLPFRRAPSDQPKAYNSLLAFRAEAHALSLTGVYDKFRLVPFGEYLPAEGLLAPLGFKKLVHVTDGFDPGPAPRPMAPQAVPPVQPLICYESLFPGFVREGAAHGGRPAWIVNISNDAWFGRTSGPWQHLNIASYRAIETGLPMVRATPTGVSAVIDAYGRVRPGAWLGQGAFGVIDAPLPPALAPTPFSRWGELFFWLMMTLSAAIARYARMNRGVTTTV